MTDDEAAAIETADKAILNKHVMLLREHFDTVQIFCTRVENGGYTVQATDGRGNWFARLGQIWSWITRTQSAEFSRSNDEEAS